MWRRPTTAPWEAETRASGCLGVHATRSAIVLQLQASSSQRWARPWPFVVSVKFVERVKGIEPSYEAWEAAVLPLNYTRGYDDFSLLVDRFCP